jgi:hypothetical protein
MCVCVCACVCAGVWIGSEGDSFVIYCVYVSILLMHTYVTHLDDTLLGHRDSM